MRLYCALLVTLVVLFSPKVKHSYHRFLKRYIYQYNAEKKLRKNDSLFYLTEVMNIPQATRELSTSCSRSCFFDLLAKTHPYIAYKGAIDTISRAYYTNPRGDLDYWEKKSKTVEMTEVDNCLLHQNFRRTIDLLVEYIRYTKPDSIFTISNYDEVNYQVFWAIAESSLRVIRIDRYGGELEEYDAEFYINTIAPDSFFSTTLRWEEYLLE